MDNKETSSDKGKKRKESELKNNFDLLVFKAGNDECDATNYAKCTAMNRLIGGFTYYSLLNIVNNENDLEIFAHFVMEIYCELNDDYIHFQEYHQHELEQIYKDLINKKHFNECDINKCKYTARHHRSTMNETNESNHVLDPKINFYKDVMDGLHFYLFHCFDAGLRIMNTDDDDENKEEKGGDIEYFDAVFARMHRKIAKREQNRKAFERFSVQNTKFTILTQSKGNSDDHLYRDEIFKYLLKINVNIDGIKSLYHLMETQDFDTDSIQFDESLESNGNIIKNIENETFKNIYIEFIKETKISSQSFAIGFRFYYWIYYKYKKQLIDTTNKNYNDHSGFEVKELFILAKYVSLKEEITNNKHISLNQYQEIVIKVNEYKQSDRVKTITATITRFLHYDIKSGDSLRSEHLFSLLLYTDYSGLCTEFSGTFRRKNIFESLKSVIKRNQEYFWMSKYLRETVELFGQCYGDTKRWKKDYSRGPFYSGMSMAMNLNSFNMRLCSPTSTSKQIEVAMTFSGRNGMVLQLNNPRVFQYMYLHGFNASWFSKYKEEDERVFFGGFWFIKIESVRIRATKQNFEKFIFCIYYLDAILTGGRLDKLDITEDDVFIINNLMNSILNKNKEKTKTLDEYLYQTFAAFTANKTQIVLDLFSLNEIKSNNSGIRDLLMNNLEQREPKKEKEREDNDMTNLFKAEVFEIFKNIQNIIINTNNNGYFSFSLSMVALLSVIESYSAPQIIVKAKCKNNWIRDLWESSSKRLTQLYEDQNYIISMKEQEDNECWFVINKKA